jgi:putative tryptophan/tyrosine transport system substrate-binding protein
LERAKNPKGLSDGVATREVGRPRPVTGCCYFDLLPCGPGWQGTECNSTNLKRREFISLLGGRALAWPLAARGQQPALPVIGWLGATSPRAYARPAAAFRKGLSEAGFVDGQNVTIEYRWAENRYQQLPTLAADLVGRKVAVIITSGGAVSVLAAKGATATIPIVFVAGADPIKSGLVASLSRPGGNVTGISLFSAELGPKKLELLHNLVPKTAAIAFLINPENPSHDSRLREMQDAALALGRQPLVLRASNASEIDAAWATLTQRGAGGFLFIEDGFFNGRRDQLVALAARHAIPAIYEQPDFVRAGGLMSYGTDYSDGYRRAGIYTARLLKGAKPADLPVEQPTKFELVINLKAAKALGLEIPPTLLAIADEVID